MISMKNNQQTLYRTKVFVYQRQMGMTLIELMIASVLSVIVIWAVSLTFARTQELNNSIANRTKMQQSVREAINRITADAKEAGSFGCVSLANNATNVNLEATDSYNIVSDAGVTGSEFHELKNKNSFTKRWGVGLIKKANITGLVTGFTADGDGLFFQYGKGNAAGTSQTFYSNQIDWPLFSDYTNNLYIAANCNTIKWIKITNTKINNTDAAIKITTGSEAPADAVLMKYVGNLYVVGTYQGIKGLYMLTATTDNAAWKIELVSPYITNLKELHYGYAMLNANDACTPDTPINSAVVYRFSSMEDSTVSSGIAPMAVVFDLSAQFIDYKPNQKTAAVASEDKGEIVNYEWITAMVREGNVCANRVASD